MTGRSPRVPRTLTTFAERASQSQLTPSLPAQTIDDILAIDLNKPYHAFIREVAERYWLHKLQKYHNRMSVIARICGVNRTDMYKRIQKLGIEPPHRKARAGRWKEFGL